MRRALRGKNAVIKPTYVHAPAMWNPSPGPNVCAKVIQNAAVAQMPVTMAQAMTGRVRFHFSANDSSTKQENTGSTTVSGSNVNITPQPGPKTRRTKRMGTQKLSEPTTKGHAKSTSLLFTRCVLRRSCHPCKRRDRAQICAGSQWSKNKWFRSDSHGLLQRQRWIFPSCKLDR